VKSSLWVTRCFVVAVSVFCLWKCVNVVCRDQQWDLKVYYYAGAAYLAGEDPYDRAVLNRLAHGQELLPFIQPPATLPGCALLAELPYRWTSIGYLVLQLVAIGALVSLWARCFVRGRANGLIFFTLCTLGYRMAFFRDVRAGNLTSFEQLLLWLGLAYYLRNRLYPYVFLVAAASVCKTFNLVLGLPALLSHRWQAVAALLLAVGSLAGINLAFWLWNPSLTASFLRRMTTPTAGFELAGGTITPASLPFFREAADHLKRVAGRNCPSLGPALYGAYVFGLAVLVAWSIRRYNFSADRLSLLVVFYLAYALVMPRFKDYYYILLLVPSYVVITRALTTTRAKVLALLAVCVPVTDYQPLFAALILFVVYLAHLRQLARGLEIDPTLSAPLPLSPPAPTS
jgi:hypothetical protein